MFLTPFVSLDRSRAAWPDISREFGRLFERFDADLVGVSASDDATHWTLRAWVPGFAVDDVKLDATGDALTLRGVRKVEAPEGWAVHRREREALQFSRIFRFPQPIDADQITATLVDGVLTVRVPKRPEVQPRTVPIVPQA